MAERPANKGRLVFFSQSDFFTRKLPLWVTEAETEAAWAMAKRPANRGRLTHTLCCTSSDQVQGLRAEAENKWKGIV